MFTNIFRKVQCIVVIYNKNIKYGDNLGIEQTILISKLNHSLPSKRAVKPIASLLFRLYKKQKLAYKLNIILKHGYSNIIYVIITYLYIVSNKKNH